MSRILKIRTTDEMLAEVLEYEARETARLMAEYDPAEEIDDHPSDPTTWPAWTDADCWVPSDPPAFEPSPEDRRWLAPKDLVPDAEACDWAEYQRWAEQVESMHKLTDADLANAGLPIG